MLWKIKVVAERASDKDRETLIFAAEELKKYLLQCVKDEIIICIDDRAGSDALRLGTAPRQRWSQGLVGAVFFLRKQRERS